MVSDGEGRAGRDPDPGAGRTSPGQMEDVFWAGWNLSGPQSRVANVFIHLFSEYF